MKLEKFYLIIGIVFLLIGLGLFGYSQFAGNYKEGKFNAVCHATPWWAKVSKDMKCFSSDWSESFQSRNIGMTGVALSMIGILGFGLYFLEWEKNDN